MTLDQLRYWDRLGILVPERIGARRVYFREQLEHLALIQNLMARGIRPREIRLQLILQGLQEKQSVSKVRFLTEMFQQAKKGDVIVQPLAPSKLDYNSAYVRLRRQAEKLGKTVGRGKDVEIMLSDDEKSLEAHIRR